MPRASEANALAAEPAYDHITELELGVLADLGVQPTGGMEACSARLE